MRLWLAIGVILFGLMTVGAGAVAMYRHAIIADETGISGWNPALWLVLFAGAAVFLLGTVQIADAVGSRPARPE
ncbi:exported hypothetical protein [Microbacterium sp. C448]|uniref:hypothetical protein n=1 Tax=Microbacterium sp. C448 TaxID=1177594 RepID=UPI0003DE5FE4|nr:hypothetical protein [Microbacterium sp. C448]CDK00282.1 exported hypothetical protein [Microbacterium sp. C448]|tara:strand:- start:1286 stop:1507 length:222 start_codon:yes stop_codon:yes gene_type:complete